MMRSRRRRVSRTGLLADALADELIKSDVLDDNEGDGWHVRNIAGVDRPRHGDTAIRLRLKYRPAGTCHWCGKAGIMTLDYGNERLACTDCAGKILDKGAAIAFGDDRDFGKFGAGVKIRGIMIIPGQEGEEC